MALMKSIDRPALHGVGDYTRFSFTAMGSPCEVIYAARSHAAAEAFRDTVVDWVSAFENQFSFYRKDSLVSRVNRDAGGEGVAIDETATELLSLCNWYYWLTEGVFDPTAGPLLRLWDYHDPEAAIPSEGQVAAARDLVGWSRVEYDEGRLRLPEPGMAIDFGGIGKEYAIDQVMAIASREGMRDVLVNFGHDVRMMGCAPQGGMWRVGLEDPRSPERCWSGVSIDNGAVCTSGDYRRYRTIEGKRYGHIVDCRTGYPVANGCLSVTVIATSSIDAGILSTTAFVMGADDGLQMLARHFGSEGAIWTESGAIQAPGFAGYVVDDHDSERVFS